MRAQPAICVALWRIEIRQVAVAVCCRRPVGDDVPETDRDNWRQRSRGRRRFAGCGMGPTEWIAPVRALAVEMHENWIEAIRYPNQSSGRSE
jgi:hypothetical protein